MTELLPLPPFKPSLLLRPGALQTLCAAIPLRASPWASAQLQTLALPLANTNESLGAHALFHPNGKHTTVVLVHGLGGSHKSAYLQRAARELFAHGFNVVALDLRGAGLSTHSTASLYHAGLVHDVADALRALSHNTSVRDLVLMGFSMGGHVSLRVAALCTELPAHSLRAVVSISAPLDLEATAHNFDKWPATPYRWVVLQSLREMTRSLQQRHPQRLSLSSQHIESIRTIYDYDSRVIVPLHGFNSTRDYYKTMSVGQHLHSIQRPTLLIHAENDPMVLHNDLRSALQNTSRAVQIEILRDGGHVGFVHRFGTQTTRPWYVTSTIAFLHQIGVGS